MVGLDLLEPELKTPHGVYSFLVSIMYTEEGEGKGKILVRSSGLALISVSFTVFMVSVAKALMNSSRLHLVFTYIYF